MSCTTHRHLENLFTISTCSVDSMQCWGDTRLIPERHPRVLVKWPLKTALGSSCCRIRPKFLKYMITRLCLESNAAYVFSTGTIQERSFDRFNEVCTCVSTISWLSLVWCLRIMRGIALSTVLVCSWLWLADLCQGTWWRWIHSQRAEISPHTLGIPRSPPSLGCQMVSMAPLCSFGPILHIREVCAFSSLPLWGAQLGV